VLVAPLAAVGVLGSSLLRGFVRRNATSDEYEAHGKRSLANGSVREPEAAYGPARMAA
jgi:hypothetical protein